MAKPYTLRKSKSGIRIMSLSEEMMAQMEASPIDAVRLTIQLTFKAIEELTGSRVALDADQYDRLAKRLNEPALVEGPDASKVWHWITQGARAKDVGDMRELLRVTSAAATAVKTLDQAMMKPGSRTAGNQTQSDLQASEPMPSPSPPQKSKP